MTDSAHYSSGQLLSRKGSMLQGTKVRLCGHSGQVYLHWWAVEDQLESAVGGTLPEGSNKFEAQPLDGPEAVPYGYLTGAVLPRHAPVR